jgi:AcrR family transcriptional regulator
VATAIDPELPDPSADHPARERIVAAAIEVFGTFGFSKSTIQEIATAARVSKPLFYRLYRNKQDVFAAAVDHVFSEWHAELRERVDRAAGGTAGALRVLFVGMLEYGRARPFLNRLLTRDSQLLLSTQGEVWDRACLELRQLIEAMLREGIEAGEVRDDLPVTHMADLLTEIHFVYANRQLITGTAVEPVFAASLVESMLGGVMRPR